MERSLYYLKTAKYRNISKVLSPFLTKVNESCNQMDKKKFAEDL